MPNPVAVSSRAPAATATTTLKSGSTTEFTSTALAKDDKKLQEQQPPLPKRLPQPTDARGVIIALTVIAAWIAVYCHALLRVKLSGPDRSSLLHIAATFFSLEYLYTGLFITTHDAMHGSIAPTNRRLNDAIGRVAITLYAWFNYRMLHKKHWEHHDHTGRVGEDPDFHHGDPAVWKWYLQFMATYANVSQFVKITVETTATMLLLGVPMANVVLFKAVAGLLSSVRLFYFGTYVPHRPSHPAEVMPWQKSRSAQCSRVASMLRCYCFDFHWEHHKWPYAPWWQLGDYKALVRQGKIVLA